MNSNIDSAALAEAHLLYTTAIEIITANRVHSELAVAADFVSEQQIRSMFKGKFTDKQITSVLHSVDQMSDGSEFNNIQPFHLGVSAEVVAENWWVKGMFYKQQTSLFFAQQGVGKSTLCAALAINGLTVDGEVNHDALPAGSQGFDSVIWLAAEAYEQTKHNLAHACKARGINPEAIADRVVVIPLSGLDDVSINRIRQLAAKLPGRTQIFIDSYAAAVATLGINENANELTTPLKKSTDALTKIGNWSIAVIAHPARGKDHSRGHTSLPSFVDIYGSVKRSKPHVLADGSSRVRMTINYAQAEGFKNRMLTEGECVELDLTQQFDYRMAITGLQLSNAVVLDKSHPKRVLPTPAKPRTGKKDRIEELLYLPEIASLDANEANSIIYERLVEEGYYEDTSARAMHTAVSTARKNLRSAG